MRADEEQRIESLRPANRVITPAQVFNGSLNTVGGKQIILLPVNHEERGRHRQRADIRIVHILEQTGDHP